MKKDKTLPRVGAAYLRESLPASWEKYFTGRKAGRYWGLSIECPVCGTKPPSRMSGYRKWRWLSVHMAGHPKGAE